MEFNCENCGWSKVVGSPIFCEYSEKRTFRENCCEAWKPKNNPVTNADKIRKMSDEELADYLAEKSTAPSCTGKCHKDYEVYGELRTFCHDCWLNWLKQEVESDA